MNFFVFLILYFGLSITNINAMAKEIKHQAAAPGKKEALSLLKLIQTVDTEAQLFKTSGKTSIRISEFIKLEEKFNKIIFNELDALSTEETGTGKELEIGSDPEQKTIVIIGILVQKLNFSRYTILYGLIYLENLLLDNTELVRDFDHVSQLFIVCCLLASKANEDSYRSNKYWASLFYNHCCKSSDKTTAKRLLAIQETLELINALEILILTSTSWTMAITRQRLEEFVTKLYIKYQALLESTPTVFRSYKKLSKKICYRQNKLNRH